MVQSTDAEIKVRAPLETMTRQRIYATVDRNNNIKYISFYKNGKRWKTLDVYGRAHQGINPPHVHYGYNHSENGFRNARPSEKRFIELLLRRWERLKNNK